MTRPGPLRPRPQPRTSAPWSRPAALRWRPRCGGGHPDDGMPRHQSQDTLPHGPQSPRRTYGRDVSRVGWPYGTEAALPPKRLSRREGQDVLRELRDVRRGHRSRASLHGGGVAGKRPGVKPASCVLRFRAVSVFLLRVSVLSGARVTAHGPGSGSLPGKRVAFLHQMRPGINIPDSHVCREKGGWVLELFRNKR
jgi:hypothetical protein